MNSVRFSAGPSGRRLVVLLGFFLAVFHVWHVYFFVTYMPDISLSIDDRAAIPMLPEILPPLSVVASATASLLIVILAHRSTGPDNNHLLLDQSGLSYMRGGESRHWPWSVLPEFKTDLRYGQIKFVLPEGEIKPKRRDPWIHEVTPDGPVVAINAIYDAPFDEIAATLNDYRDHALANAPEGRAGAKGDADADDRL